MAKSLRKIKPSDDYRGGLEKFLIFDEAATLAVKEAEKQPPPVVPLPPKPKKAKVERKSKNDVAREKRVKRTETEVKHGGCMINIKKCFHSELRIAAEVLEEIRTEEIDRLEVRSRLAEESAKKKGRKTILLEDIV